MSTGSCAVCKKKAHLKCARCESVFYCGKEHQKANWSDHLKTNCLAYKVKSCYDTRYVTATRDLKKGETIVIETPLAFGPEEDSCPGCFRRLPRNQIYVRCARCKWPVCHRKCAGLKDPLFHGAECEVLSAIRDSFVTHSKKALLPLRCLLLQRNDPAKWQALYRMACLTDEMSSKTSKGEGYFFVQEAVLKPLAKAAPHLLPPSRSEAVLRRVFALADCLGVRIKQPHRAGMIAMLPVTSLMEHSCLPNTRLTFRDPFPSPDGSERRCQVVVTATEDIDRGDEITACFVDLFSPSLSRQTVLEENRNSLCFCERCMDPTELGTHLDSLRCQTQTCSGTVLPEDPDDIFETDWKCDGKCGKTLTADQVEQTRRLIYNITDPKSHETQMQFLSTVKAKVDKYAHPQNFLSLIIKQRMVHFCIERIDEEDIIVISELKESADYCREVLSVFLNECLIEQSYDKVADMLHCLARINLEILKRQVASKEVDSTGAKLSKKYCAELKLLGTRFGNADYTDSDLQSLRGNDIRLAPF